MQSRFEKGLKISSHRTPKYSVFELKKSMSIKTVTTCGNMMIILGHNRYINYSEKRTSGGTS